MKYINPYSSFGALHKTSLDYIIANLPLNPTFDQLNEQLVNSFYIPDPANPDPLDWMVRSLKTVLPNTYNGYVNGRTLDTRRKIQEVQQPSTENSQPETVNRLTLVSKMLEGVSTAPVLSINDYLSTAEESIIGEGLTIAEQTPLLLAIAIGKASNEYWLSQIQVAAAWVNYLNAETSINYGNLPGWVRASMQGALISYGIIPLPPLPFADQLVSTVAGTGLVSGKVIFNWIEGM